MKFVAILAAAAGAAAADTYVVNPSGANTFSLTKMSLGGQVIGGVITQVYTFAVYDNNRGASATCSYNVTNDVSITTYPANNCGVPGTLFNAALSRNTSNPSTPGYTLQVKHQQAIDGHLTNNETACLFYPDSSVGKKTYQGKSYDVLNGPESIDLAWKSGNVCP